MVRVLKQPQMHLSPANVVGIKHQGHLEKFANVVFACPLNNISP